MTPAGICPACAAPGRPVPRKTPANLLADPSGLGDGPFSFCPTPHCEIVYFDLAGLESYGSKDLVVPVGIKRTKDPIPLCYCFGFTRAMMRDELERTGRTSIPRRIRDGIAAGECACSVKNPQGSCCLGQVNAAVAALGGTGKERVKGEQRA